MLDSGTDLNNTEGGDSLEKYDLAIEELEAKIAPIGISQGGQRWGGFGGG